MNPAKRASGGGNPPKTIQTPKNRGLFKNTRGRIRTLNLLIRSQVLYPVELRTQIRRFLSGYEDNPSMLKKQVHYP